MPLTDETARSDDVETPVRALTGVAIAVAVVSVVIIAVALGLWYALK